MRVVFFINHFFPNPTGATYSAIRLARSLRERGVHIQWVVDDVDGRYRSGGEYEEFPVISFSLKKKGKIRKFKELLRLTRFLFQHCKQLDIFHVHGGGHMNILIAGWIKLLMPQIKVMLKCTSDGWDTPDGVLKEKYGRILLWVYQRLDGIVAMTSGKLKKIKTYGCKGTSVVIPNGTDCERYCPDPGNRKLIRNKLGIPDHACVLAYVGWLGRGKGTDVLFSVWHRLLERHPNLFLLTVGDYRKDRDADAELVALFAKTGLDPALLAHPQYVRVGRVDDAEHYLQASDIFVFPSRKEGFGTVQTEAMACGLPCVVNNLPGVSKDIFPDDSFGFVVDDNSEDQYFEYIERLINDAPLRHRIGGAARSRVLECFSPEVVAAKYIQMYSDMLRR